MLGENIKQLRKLKGYSQEILAQRLHVVRQTVSKWEKGISVPDAEMLNRIAELFDVPVNQLLDSTMPAGEDGSEIAELAKQLAVLNGQLANAAVRKRTIMIRAAFAVVAALLLAVVLYMTCFWIYRVQPRQNAARTTVNLECTLDGETYLYGVTYDEQYRVLEAGGDAWIDFHVQTVQYEDANVLIAQIEDYFTERGGTCKVLETKTTTRLSGSRSHISPKVEKAAVYQ